VFDIELVDDVKVELGPLEFLITGESFRKEQPLESGPRRC
jgi:hypothetical protein